MILVLAIIYLIAGFSAAILMHYSRPKIKFQIPKEYEQLEKEVKGWIGGET